MQFNFQHYFYPPHTDGCGFLQPKLIGRDGFGNEIAILQPKGFDTRVYFVGQVPHSDKYVGLNFKVKTGDVWSMTGIARYQHLHAVMSLFQAAHM